MSSEEKQPEQIAGTDIPPEAIHLFDPFSLRRMGDTRRFHTFPIPNPSTTGQHSYNVVKFLLMVLEEPSMDLIRVGMFHDISEYILGDPPRDGKLPGFEQIESLYIRAMEKGYGVRLTCGESSLSEKELSLFKFADFFDAVEEMMVSVSMGNDRIFPMSYRQFSRLLLLAGKVQTLLSEEENTRFKNLISPLVSFTEDYRKRRYPADEQS